MLTFYFFIYDELGIFDAANLIDYYIIYAFYGSSSFWNYSSISYSIYFMLFFI